MPLDTSSIENRNQKLVTESLKSTVNTGASTRDGMLINGKPIVTNEKMILGKNTGNPGAEQSRHFVWGYRESTVYGKLGEPRRRVIIPITNLPERVKTPRAKGWIGPGESLT